jgi:hypothetical protein
MHLKASFSTVALGVALATMSASNAHPLRNARAVITGDTAGAAGAPPDSLREDPELWKRVEESTLAKRVELTTEGPPGGPCSIF